MIETQVRALFGAIASEPAPGQVDTELARRRGRARLRWRRAGQAGAPVLAAAAVAAVALAVGAVPFRGGPGPAPASAVAPRQFDPLVPYASFGWLPAGESLQSGGTARWLGYQMAGPSPANSPWTLQAFAGGRCRLGGPPRTLRCTLGPIPEAVLRLGARAPEVHGHQAFWSRSRQSGIGVGYLAWQYAHGGWALLSWTGPESPGLAWQPQAVRIADHVRFGAHAAPPLAFAARLTGLPASWRVSGVTYRPHGAVLLATQYQAAAGPAVLNPYEQARPDVPVLDIQPASARGSCALPPDAHWVREVIGGYRVLVSSIGRHVIQPTQMLCARHADGLWVQVTVFGSHPVMGVTEMFAHHLRLLGPDPAHWARNPLG